MEKRSESDLVMRRRYLLIVFLCAAVLIVSVLILRFWLAGPPQYKVTFLTTPSGDRFFPFSINDHGQVVGLAKLKDGEDRIILWDKDNGAQDLGSFDYPKHTGPLTINNSGHIMGTVRDPNGNFRAFIRNLDGQKQLLNGLDGNFSVASGLNNHHQVVGFSTTKTGYVHAVLWNGNANVTDLGTLGGPESLASCINDRGQIAGFSQVASGKWHAFFWDPNSGIKDLGPTSLSPPTKYHIYLNNSGFVIGRFGSASDQKLLSTWTDSQGTLPLPSPSKYDAHPIALNDNNQVLLNIRTVFRLFGQELSGKTEQYLWDPNEGFVSFKKKLGRMNIHGSYPRAVDINNKGQIVGRTFQKKTKQSVGVLLDPIK